MVKEKAAKKRERQKIFWSFGFGDLKV